MRARAKAVEINFNSLPGKNGRGITSSPQTITPDGGLGHLARSGLLINLAEIPSGEIRERRRVENQLHRRGAHRNQDFAEYVAIHRQAHDELARNLGQPTGVMR